jgi:phage-Barnase-EndoU-ColicinE5/D-RelE like nuclease3
MRPAILAGRRMWRNTGHQVYEHGAIGADEASKIMRETGLDISGYCRFMATRGVRHVKNNHSDPIREARQMQYPVTPDDFALIPMIAATGLARLVGIAGGRKPARLEHRATIDGKLYVYLETVGINDKRLELWTMRIEKCEKY